MFTLPDLPYDYNALEPYIDEETMKLHHDKHHQTYVDKLNAAIKGTEFENAELTELLQNIDNLPENIRFTVRANGGGHYNHTFFWNIMTPVKNEPSADLLSLIESTFGTFDDFKNKFSEAAAGVFGSGWVWLIQDNGQLIIEKSPLQDSPMMRSIEPILGLDVWEHAYYLKYQNKRPDYIDAWWSVVNWKAVEDRVND